MSIHNIPFSTKTCLAVVLFLLATSVHAESAYTLEAISKEEYQNDTTGRVFEETTVAEDGTLNITYYRYDINESKTYDTTVTKTKQDSGDGSEGFIGVGFGVNNTETHDSVDNTLYKGNSFDYEYTGTGANVYIDGGAIFNTGTINNNEDTGVAIQADFIENSITASQNVEKATFVQGAAIANYGNIGNIDGSFIKNSISGNHAEGGAIYNGAIYGEIKPTPVPVPKTLPENSITETDNILQEKGIIQDINGAFIGNTAEGEDAKGGAIFNLGQIKAIDGDFIANTVTASTQANGGAIHNNDKDAYISSISGRFIGNIATTEELKSTSLDVNNNEPSTYSTANGKQAWGGAIDNHKGEIGKISGYFSNNQVIGTTTGADAIGGAVVNYDGKVDSISGTFVSNKAIADSIAAGGAVYNDSYLNTVSGNFIDNSASAKTQAYGGALYHDGIGDNPTLAIVNSNFINNSVSGATAQGGAIWADYVEIIADATDSLFHGNTANGESNAAWIEGDSASVRGNLTLNAKNQGNVIFDDAIDGDNYDIDVAGDGSGEVVFNNTVNNVTNFTLTDNATMHLGTAGRINTENFTNADNTTLVLDVEIDKQNNTINNGLITVSDDVSGTTNVVVNSLNRDKLASLEDAYTLFLTAENDNLETDSSFNVTRVIGSPYKWGAFRNHLGETEGSNWYLAVTGDGYMPEIPDYVGIHTATIEQTRGLTGKISDALRANRNKGCCDRKFRTDRDSWISVDYMNAKIDAPSEMDADIKGVTAGFDLAANATNRLGVFGSYRQGKYDLNGKSKLPSDIGSNLDIDSYLGGLYYQYHNRNWSILSTLFAGKQDINTKTDDHSAHADTDATQYGMSLELARQFYLPRAWIITPSLGVYYTAIDVDGFTDNVENNVEYDLLHYVEAELGLRFEHLFCREGWTTKVYIKPSVIQTFASGDSVRIDSLRPINSYKNQLLGKMEVGAKFGITPALSAYTSANYTFGSDYRAYGVDAGLAYSW